MKIFLSFLQSAKKHPIPAYDFWQFYIKNGIEEAGHQWVECPDVDWALGLVPQSKADYATWKSDTWTKTIVWLKKHPADLFLSYLYPAQVDISAVKEIQSLGIPCVNFFCDNIRQFRKAPVEYKVFDLNWVPEAKAISMYQKAGYRYIHLPMPMWVHPDDRVIRQEQYDQVTFIGSVDLQRQILLEEIIRLDPDLPLALYGNGWDKNKQQLNPVNLKYSLMSKLLHQFEFISQQGLKAYLNKINNRNYTVGISTALFSKYKGIPQAEQYKILTACSMIIVGINRYPSFHFPLFKPDTYSRLRDIEAPMLGACYLTEYTEGIEELYDTTHEITTYKTPEEFIDKVKELRANAGKRKSLKINGQKRALQEHSIPHSLKMIEQKLVR